MDLLWKENSEGPYLARFVVGSSGERIAFGVLLEVYHDSIPKDEDSSRRILSAFGIEPGPGERAGLSNYRFKVRALGRDHYVWRVGSGDLVQNYTNRCRDLFRAECMDFVGSKLEQRFIERTIGKGVDSLLSWSSDEEIDHDDQFCIDEIIRIVRGGIMPDLSSTLDKVLD